MRLRVHGHLTVACSVVVMSYHVTGQFGLREWHWQPNSPVCDIQANAVWHVDMVPAAQD